MTDKYDELRGEDLDKALPDDVDTSTGGSNTDGSWSAADKRNYLRNADDEVDGRNPYSLTDDQRAQAQSGPVPRLYADALRDAHSRGDRDEIAELTAAINDDRERKYAHRQDKAAA